MFRTRFINLREKHFGGKALASDALAVADGTGYEFPSARHQSGGIRDDRCVLEIRQEFEPRCLASA